MNIAKKRFIYMYDVSVQMPSTTHRNTQMPSLHTATHKCLQMPSATHRNTQMPSNAIRYTPQHTNAFTWIMNIQAKELNEGKNKNF